jgi:hypothetical protein
MISILIDGKTPGQTAFSAFGELHTVLTNRQSGWYWRLVQCISGMALALGQ